MNLFSSFNRKSLLEKLSSEEYDLLVIGGGITGAGIALDAASRGIKTALVEKNDFAFGTSSRSTKLIHGGLRYLKQFEFGLVKEVGRERAIAYHNAPHLVVPEKMLLPLVKGGTYGKLATSIGLFIYDLLAGVNMSEWRKMLSKKETLNEEPLLREDILEGSGLYAEYRTDDARLTLEIMKTAVKQGAFAANYVEAKKFILEPTPALKGGNPQSPFRDLGLKGAQCIDSLTGSTFTIRAKQIVNAAGPWVDEIRKTDATSRYTSLLDVTTNVSSSSPDLSGRIENYLQGKRLHLTKGVHIVIPKEKLALKHSVYFDVNDGRMIFAIPRGKITYIGTTDTNYSAKIDSPVATKADVDYLLNATNGMFPSAQLKIQDVISSWAGLRPLIHEDGKSPSELSRKDEIFISESGLISIAGGKLTGYRIMAKKVVDIVAKRLQKNSVCTTAQITIQGGEFSSSNQVKEYIDAIHQTIRSYSLEKYRAEYLVRTYGKQCDVILKKFAELTDVDAEIRLAKAECWFAVNFESAYTLEDFFMRRTGKILFEPESIKKLIPVIVEEMKNYFSWTEEKCIAEKNKVEEALKQSVAFE